MNRKMSAVMFVAMLMGAQAAWAMDIPDAASPDARVFAARCAVCHALPHPKRLSWPAWRHMLHVMKRRMQERDIRLSDEDWHRIAAYLEHHAR